MADPVVDPVAAALPVALPLANGALPAEDPAGEVVASIARAQTISADEIALYDRQIRLWGVQAQERLRSANVLLISIKALANEVAKNLVLAGIKSLTIVDHEIVTEDDLGSQFFIAEDDVGKNRAKAAAPQIQKLNPRVAIMIDTSDISTKVPEFYQPFDIVIATDLDYTTLSTVDASTRLSQKPFYAAGAHGMYGYIFADLIQHDYVIEREKSNIATALKQESATRSIIAFSDKGIENGKRMELVTKREIYSPLLLANTSPLPPEYQGNRRKLRQVTPLLTCIRALWEFQKANARNPSHTPADLQLFTTLATDKHKELQLPIETLTSEFLRKFLQNLGSELAPVTAFLGGQLAQDVINVIGRREQPIQNLMLFDGDESKAPVYAMHPIFTT
ncbi:putative sumo activating enzyme protein [Neofusicoccum parvum]|nr:putative sumo activating enzyme protein [Neofusicoccum parvum]